jgi:hypothetical protein
MSDDIRDRVIEALVSIRCDLEKPCENCRTLATQDADAVARELGLRQERQQGPYQYLYRYATDWMTDD